MASTNKYGHIRRNSQSGSQAWKWAVIVAVGLWGLSVCFLNTGRIAALLGHHPALGKPAFTVSGYRCYWPWKLLE